jgi:hypothetical protein
MYGYYPKYKRPLDRTLSRIAKSIDIEEDTLDSIYNYIEAKGWIDEDAESLKNIGVDNLYSELDDRIASNMTPTEAIIRSYLTVQGASNEEIEKAIQECEGDGEGEGEESDSESEGEGEESDSDKGKKDEGKKKFYKASKKPKAKHNTEDEATERTESSEIDPDKLAPADWDYDESDQKRLKKKIAEYKIEVKTIKGIDVKGDTKWIEDPDGPYNREVKVKDMKEAYMCYEKDNRNEFVKLKALSTMDYYVTKSFRKVTKQKKYVIYLDNSSSMDSLDPMSKTYAILEYFLEQYKKNEIDLVIVLFEGAIDKIYWLNDYTPKAGIINKFKSMYKRPPGGGTNISNAINLFNKTELPAKVKSNPSYQHFLEKDTIHLIVNDGADRITGKLDNKTHGIAYVYNEHVANACRASGGTYTVL